jgi:hypothetical protein
VVQGIDVEIAEVGVGGSAWGLAGEDGVGVREDVVEKIELDVLSREWLGIVALDGERLTTEVPHERSGLVWPARKLGGGCHESHEAVRRGPCHSACSHDSRHWRRRAVPLAELPCGQGGQHDRCRASCPATRTTAPSLESTTTTELDWTCPNIT